ncbi:response regulator [Clostridium paraputrificum]|uniref:response regulator n=1 Tax=Clostridium TaxID=1485 RepID=UPI003D324B1F
MPILDVYEATEAIRKSSHKDAKTIPIIAITANAFGEDVEQALKSGMNSHISKPIDQEVLYYTIYKFMNGEFK